MPTWRKRALRGSYLEEVINRSNEYYSRAGLALIQKIPTPITPVEYNNTNHQITLAYFEKKSTVDYIGVVQGLPVCFDAKECAKERFRVDNIHEHQYKFMKEFEKQDGLSFLILYFSSIERYYYMRFQELDFIFTKYLNGEMKSFHVKDLDDRFFLDGEKDATLKYLDLINLDLSLR